MIFSIHTFELSLVFKTNIWKYAELKSEAYEKSKGSHRIIKIKNRNDYSDAFADEAIASDGIRVEYHDYLWNRGGCIKLIVNPSKVLGGDDIPKLWKPTDRNIKALLHNLKANIKRYFDANYKLNDFKLTRVDFTVNIDVGSRENVFNYIRILHNLGKVKGFTPKYKKSNKWIDKALSFDLQGKSRGFEFSAYDKEAQSGKKEANGILRVEIRLVNVKTKGGTTSEQIKLMSKASEEIFMKCFRQVVPRGDHYTKKQAIKFIEDNIANFVPNKRERENTLSRMQKLIELIPVKKSLWIAQKALEYRDIDRIMTTFAELNISPVTISKNMKLKSLKSLYFYLED